MKRTLLFFCLFIVVGALLAYKIHQGSGYILIVWGNTSIEMSLWFGIAAVIVIWLLWWFLLALLRGSFRGIVSAKQRMTGRGARKAQQQTMEGLVHFIEGDWMPAYKKLTRSVNKSASPIINYLAAARCAYESGDEQNALELLHQAEKSTKNSDLAVALTQARMQLSNQQYEKALATLERVSSIKPHHNVVLNLQRQVYLALKDWSSLKALLPKLHRQDIGTVKQRYFLEQTLYREILAEQITKSKSLSASEKYTALKQCWDNIPKHFYQNTEILNKYISELVGLKKYDVAEALLATALSQEWNDQWVEQYGLLTTSNPEKALIKAEAWLKNKSNNATLLLTLGRLCLQNKQWGRARDFLGRSVAIQPVAEAYAELARLQQFLGDEAESRQASKQGLLTLAKPLLPVGDFDK